MSMIAFEEEDIGCLAVELPDLVKFYAYSGDFEGEIAAIDRLLSGGSLSGELLRKRLLLEKVIAAGMAKDYKMSFSELLNRVRETYQNATAETLTKITEMGHADFILKNGQYCYQRAAYANILKTCSRYLENLNPDGTPRPLAPAIDGAQHENAQIMREKGYRAFRHTVSFRMNPNEASLREGEELTVHLPYPAICPEQPDTRLLSFTHPVMISSSDHRTACIRTNCRKGETYGVTFEFVHVARYCQPDPERVLKEQPTFFTGEKLPQIRFTPYLGALAEEIRGSETNPLLIAKKIYNYITEHIRYSYMRDYLYLTDIPEFALLNGRGDCGVQALVFITLCRILGIPARWQSGCTVRASGIGSHDWAQVYIAPYGWLPVDPSFGGGAYRRGDNEMRDYYFGNLDPFRLVTCNDFQVPFDPPKRFLRMDPYDNQHGEAEYRDEGLGFGELDSERKVLGSVEIEWDL